MEAVTTTRKSLIKVAIFRYFLYVISTNKEADNIKGDRKHLRELI